MVTHLGRLLAVTAASLFCASPGLAAQAATASADQPKLEKPKPNKPDLLERRCEVITMPGSRIQKKKFCATEAEWRDYQLQDRQATEKIQMGPCVRGAGC